MTRFTLSPYGIGKQTNINTIFRHWTVSNALITEKRETSKISPIILQAYCLLVRSYARQITKEIHH